MPVHNTGIYLEEALKALFIQSFQKFELICVDDFSNDKLTKDILNQYQCRYEKMQVIWLEHNVGAGEARNVGFSKAKGEYAIFLDADDVFADDFLERMYQCICFNNADVCICGYQNFYVTDSGKYFLNKYIPDEYKVNVNNREDWLLDVSTVPWNKLCRTQFLKDNHIYFQSLSSCNDVFFSCMVMISASKRCYVDQVPLIFYRTNSKIQISANRNPINLYKAVILLYITIRERYTSEMIVQWLGALLLKNGIWEMKRCRDEKCNRQFYFLLRDFFTNHIIVFANYMLNICVENTKKFPYENKWFSDCTELLCQLRFTADKLIEKIKEEKQIFLWGAGYRGNVFQKFCQEQKINLFGVADLKNMNIGKITDYGNQIVSTECVLQSKGLIIASNREVYEYLLKRNVKLLNLSEFYIF